MALRLPSLLLPLALALAAGGPLDAATLVVANKSDATVDLVDLATGRSVATLPTGKGPHEVAVSPDGRLAVVSDYGPRGEDGSTLTVIDVAAAKVLRTVGLGRHRRPHGMAWISERELAVTTEGTAHLLVVDPHAGTVTKEIETGQRVSHMVAVAADGRRAFVANIGSGNVTAVDLAAGAKLRDIPTGDGAEGIALSPGGRELWVGNRAADTLSVLDPQSLEVVATVPCPGFPIRVAVTPDGSRALVSAARSGEVVVFDVAARKELLRRKLDLSAVAESATRLFGTQFGESPVPVGLVVAPDGATAWVAATQADAVVAVDPATLEVRGLLKAGREPDGMGDSAVAAAALSAGR
jgi:YVTN family beta-propeller protein